MYKVTNKTVSVGTSPVVVCPEVLEGQRRQVFIQNISTGGQKISMSINQDPVNGLGFVMSPGGAYSDSMDGAWYPVEFQHSVISDLAGGVVAVMEVIGDPVYRGNK